MNKELDREIQIKTMRLLTRREIIDIWLKQTNELLNTYSCKNCRDLLYNTNEKNKFYCRNCDKYFILIIEEK